MLMFGGHSITTKKLINFCTKGDLNNIIYLVETEYIDIYANDGVCFKWACKEGHLNIVKYLVNLNNNPRCKIFNYNMFNTNVCDDAVILACTYGQKNVVEYLVNLYKIPQRCNNYYNKINIHKKNESAFKYACSYGYLHIIKFLIKTYMIDIHINNDEPFRWALDFKYDSVRYLLSIGCYSIGFRSIVIL